MLMAGVMALFAARLIQIQGINADTYASEAAEARLSTFDVPTVRGDIVGTNGNTFATSIEVRTVFVDPAEVHDGQRDEIVDELSRRFDLERDKVRAKLDADPSRYEVVKRNVLPAEWKKLDELGLHGVGAKVDYKRVYPDDTGAADLVGFTGDDGGGLEGLEAVMDDTLAGEPGKRQVEMGASGTQIPMAGGLAKKPAPGRDVRLTLNQDIQWKAHQALSEQVAELDAEGGSVIAMRPTGEIVAMADVPTYSPDDIDDSSPEERSNGAVAEAFEPGSTNKVITAAGAMEEGLVQPETVFTVPDSIQRYDQTFTDSEQHETQRLTLNGIIARSSNVGTIQVGEELGADRLYDYLGKFGFGKPTGLDLPGETAGMLTDPDGWSGTRLPTVSFGQGVSVNAVQMASVYATIANGGVRAEPTILEGTAGADDEFTPAKDPKRERVVSEETADNARRMLEAVTGAEGTAPNANIPGYRVAGKTGTAERFNPETGDYEEGGYTASFVGFAPADDPELIVQAVVHDPEGDYYGNDAAAPVFSDVMSFALKTEQVPPSGSAAPDIRLFEEE